MTTLPAPSAPSGDSAAAPHDAAGIPVDAVSVRGLVKVYAGTKRTPPKIALGGPNGKGVDLAIPRGSVFGLLGPNGAGKSTLINILAGLVVKTSGRAVIWGFDIDEEPRQSRAAIGIVPQELVVDPFFTPREMLELQAGLYGVPPGERRTEEILAAVGLSDKADAYARTLSGGMRRRLMVGKAMVHSPPVLVLDEPTAGVDVELRRQLWTHVRALNARGTTILLTTHYLEEAQELCDRIAIINHGEVVACDTTENLLRRVDAKELRIRLAEPLDALPPALAGLHAELSGRDRLVLHYQPSRERLGDLLDAVRAAGLVILDATTHETDLEDIFLQLTGTADGRP
jgi:ABC-2 type transport system ATP-binding protein